MTSNKFLLSIEKKSTLWLDICSRVVKIRCKNIRWRKQEIPKEIFKPERFLMEQIQRSAIKKTYLWLRRLELCKPMRSMKILFRAICIFKDELFFNLTFSKLIALWLYVFGWTFSKHVTNHVSTEDMLLNAYFRALS